MKKVLCLVILLFSVIFAPLTFAQNNSFVSIINPIRGNDFWDVKDQTPETSVIGQIEILKKYNLPATWLLRFDVLDSNNVINILKNRSDEKGLFLEVTPSWANAAGVNYKKSAIWHTAGSAFLTGYEREERNKLIDAAFNKFKNTFGAYPLSVGAWWIDAYSLGYMQEKYGITGALIVADQYSTDNYQIWGQYFSTPYYPDKFNALHPAQTIENKLPIVMVQWAARDPVNAYGNGVYESTFSVQANDYIDYHKLNTSYFSKLLDIYTKQQFNKFGYVVVGLENSYVWEKYKGEYEKQIEVLSQKQKNNQIKIIPQRDFSNWYKQNFPDFSPEQIIVADDPLGTFKKAVWFMNPYYRVGWFINKEGEVFRDIRQYVGGEEELCFKASCESVNFATSATRVLDDVSFGQKWVIDKGTLKDFNVEKKNDNYILKYINVAGNLRNIEFLPRDIKVDERIYSIDGAILNAIKQGKESQQINTGFIAGSIKWSTPSVLIKLVKFSFFILIALFLPGLCLTNRLFRKESPILQRVFLSIIAGLAAFTAIYYLISLLNLRFLSLIYFLLSFLLFIKLKIIKSLKLNFKRISNLDIIIIFVIICGTVFQIIPTIKSGLTFDYGLGFWGPNTHDGVWHMALINQLIKSVPPENPIFSGVVLKNYHYFYDLLVTATVYITRLSVPDLVFRFYPLVFSLALGVGSYCFVIALFKNRIGEFKTKVAAIFSLYLIYFAGSFGWIVEFLRERHFGGESAFWVNQAVSFNLNPPFAISLLIMIAIFNCLLSPSINKTKGMVLIILCGTLISFKSYTGILVLGALFLLGLRKILNKDFFYFWVALISLIISVLLVLANFETSTTLIIFAPFWFIHTMIDSPDRVGWVRLSLARVTSQSLGQWPKFIGTEILSLTLFIFGNLGMRFLSFGLLFRVKEVYRNDALFYIFVLSCGSILIPILFIQSGNPWNTIQFFYPVLFISALFAGVVISHLLFKLNKVSVFILVALILIFAPINSFVTANGYLTNQPHAFVSRNEIEGLKFLFNQPEGVVLTYPYDEKLKQKISEPWPLFVYDSTAYVSAISGKSTYLEDEPQNAILLTDYKKRLVTSVDFMDKSISEGQNFLQDNNIKYIYIQKLFNKSLDENSQFIKKIFENDEIIIYKFII